MRLCKMLLGVIGFMTLSLVTVYANPIIAWTDTIDCGGWDYAYDVATDGVNNIIVTGMVTIGNHCYYTTKYSSSGTVLWADTISFGSNYGWSMGVATDGNDNIVITGGVARTTDDILTVKYNSSGTMLWADTIDLGNHEQGKAVDTDGNDNIIVAGYTGPVGAYKYYIVKYASSGTMLWADTIDLGSLERAYDVATDNNNNIIVTGHGNGGYYTVKYNPNGDTIWTRTDTVGNGSQSGVATDSDNNIIVTGYADIATQDYYTVKYDSSGTMLWADTIDLGDNDWAWGVAADNNNDIIVTGYAYIGTNNDFFTVKYTNTGGGIGERLSNGYQVLDISMKITPNPVTKGGKIMFTIPRTLPISLSIYDIGGRKTADVFEGVKDAGIHYIKLPELQTGLYFLYLNGPGIKKSEKFIVIE